MNHDCLNNIKCYDIVEITIVHRNTIIRINTKDKLSINQINNDDLKLVSNVLKALIHNKIDEDLKLLSLKDSLKVTITIQTNKLLKYTANLFNYELTESIYYNVFNPLISCKPVKSIKFNELFKLFNIINYDHYRVYDYDDYCKEFKDIILLNQLMNDTVLNDLLEPLVELYTNEHSYTNFRIANNKISSLYYGNNVNNVLENIDMFSIIIPSLSISVLSDLFAIYIIPKQLDEHTKTFLTYINQYTEQELNNISKTILLTTN